VFAKVSLILGFQLNNGGRKCKKSR
jgi:hypothetical protein